MSERITTPTSPTEAEITAEWITVADDADGLQAQLVEFNNRNNKE